MKKGAPAATLLTVFAAFLALVPRGGLCEAIRLGGNGNDFAQSACLLSDGNVLLMGQTFSESHTGNISDSAGAAPGQYASAWAVCLDDRDEIVWQYCYAGKAEANTRFLGGAEQDGRYILFATQGQAGDDALVVLDQHGEALWIAPRPDNLDVYQVCASPYGLVLAGLTWDDQAFKPWCALADASGEMVWSHCAEPFLRVNGRCHYTQVACNDDRILLYETRLPNHLAEEAECFLVEIDFEGNLLSRNRLDAPPLSYISQIVAQGSDVLFSGGDYDMNEDLQSGAVVKLNEKAEKCWEWSASYPDSNLVIEALLVMENGYFVCALRYDYRDTAFTQVRTGFLSFDGTSEGLQPLPEYGALSDPKALLISQDEIAVFGSVLKRPALQAPQDETDVFVARARI